MQVLPAAKPQHSEKMRHFSGVLTVACTLIALSTLVLGASAGVSAAASRDTASTTSTEKEKDLQKVRDRIDAIRHSIETDTSRRDALATELQAADADIRNAREQGAELRRQRQASERRVEDLQRQQHDIEADIAKQRAALADSVRIAYMNGRAEQLKLLLNQQDPAELGRMLTYYGYFGRARAERIAAISDQLRKVQALTADIAAEVERLRDLEQQNAAQTERLKQARAQRAHTIAAIKTKLKEHGEELAALKRQAATLERLIAELRSAMADFPAFVGQSFEHLKGKLPWPVKGKIGAHFGELRAGGPLKWEGISIDAQPGAQVRAPMSGRVIYADWLNGLDYLVVLDHGGGFISLYGHNEQLYRRVGDVVAPGELLGDLADRGDGKAALYMEIRKAKQPLDPERWLRKP